MWCGRNRTTVQYSGDRDHGRKASRRKSTLRTSGCSITAATTDRARPDRPAARADGTRAHLAQADSLLRRYGRVHLRRRLHTGADPDDPDGPDDPAELSPNDSSPMSPRSSPGSTAGPPCLIGHSMGGLHRLVHGRGLPGDGERARRRDMPPDFRGQTTRSWTPGSAAGPIAESLDAAVAMFGRSPAATSTKRSMTVRCTVLSTSGLTSPRNGADATSGTSGPRSPPTLVIEAGYSVTRPGRCAACAGPIRARYLVPAPDTPSRRRRVLSRRDRGVSVHEQAATGQTQRYGGRPAGR